MFGIQIALCVLLWGNQCATTATALYTYLHPWLIAQLVFLGLSLCVACCICLSTFCIACASAALLLGA